MKKIKQQPTSTNKPAKSNRSIATILVTLMLLSLMGLGLGIYYQLLPKTIIPSYLASLPVIGPYISSSLQTDNIGSLDAKSDLAVQPVQQSAPPASTITNVSELAVTTLLSEQKSPNIATKQQANAASDVKNVSKIVNIYSSIKAEEAVSIMSNMDDPTVVSILLRMDNEVAGKILGAMDPKRAATLSKLMLEAKNNTTLRQ